MQTFQKLRRKVRDVYSAAAEHPETEHPFPVGPSFAESIGYPAELLASVPPVCVGAFAGVSNVSVSAEIAAGSAVLDLGCGAGLDSQIAARRTGSNGTVIGIDFSEAMLCRAHEGAVAAAMPNLFYFRSDAERLPLRDDSIDVALLNGIFNLNPSRAQIFKELARVMRRGGTVYAAELIVSGPLPQEELNETNWFA